MDGPIPGESLTKEPRAAQYERPPKFANPNEAFEAYLEKFDNPENLDGLMSILEAGMPLSSIVTVMTREAVRAGIHSIDTAVILRPMVHEYLAVLAKEAGVEFIEDIEDTFKSDQASKRQRAQIAARVEKQLSSSPSGMNTEEEEDTPEETIEDIFEEEDEAPMEPKPTGLMKRPTEGM